MTLTIYPGLYEFLDQLLDSEIIEPPPGGGGGGIELFRKKTEKERECVTRCGRRRERDRESECVARYGKRESVCVCVCV